MMMTHDDNDGDEDDDDDDVDGDVDIRNDSDDDHLPDHHHILLFVATIVCLTLPSCHHH